MPPPLRSIVLTTGTAVASVLLAAGPPQASAAVPSVTMSVVARGALTASPGHAPAHPPAAATSPEPTIPPAGEQPAHDMTGHDMTGHDMTGSPPDGSGGGHDHGSAPGVTTPPADSHDSGGHDATGHDSGTNPGSGTHSEHGETAPTFRPRVLVLGGFGVINGMVLVSAYVLRRRKRRTPDHRRPAARATRVPQPRLEKAAS